MEDGNYWNAPEFRPPHAKVRQKTLFAAIALVNADDRIVILRSPVGGANREAKCLTMIHETSAGRG